MGIYALKILELQSKMSSGPQSSRISPRKFSEKIALLNKKEREANAKFEQIINEVHSTISQPAQLQKHQKRHHSTVDSARLGPQLSSDEFQAMLESSRYQAAHSDSLEEIERVYENLMKNVGQCDYPQAPADTNKQCFQQQFIACTGANSTHSTSNTISASSNSLLSRDVAPFYHQQKQQQQQQQRNNQFHGTNPDLNNNHLNQGPPKSPNFNYIPCGPANKCAIRPANKSLFSSHNMLETHVSSSYLPHATDPQDICMPDSQTRGRVVSFGSASREKYRAAPISQHNLLLAKNQQQAEGALICDKSHAHELSQPHQTQYLEEPSSDRFRQKSCSDPQLNVQPAAQYSMGPMDQCKSDNRLAVSSPTEPTVGHTTTPFTCCSNTTSGPIEIAKTHAHQNSNADYFLNTNTTKVNQSSQSGQVSTTTSGLHFEPCDTTSSSGTSELPGIKICTIGDNGQQYAASNQRRVFNSGESPCSRDSSLPDIANLRFGNNSARTPSEEHRHSFEPLNSWPTGEANGQCCQMKQNEPVQMVDSCEALDGGWQQYGTPSSEVKMEVQTSDQLLCVSNRCNEPAGGRETVCWSSNNQPINSQHQQSALKALNNLSNSDYGFSLASSAHHEQQGNLMICTSSELYNNIFRSRSHSNIDYLAKQAGGGGGTKRVHLYAQNLPQFEEHHTSQYCLQTAEQPVMIVRRIEELKAQGGSTSPLNSSSNLNSPQSDVNSPGGSSTITEQCEPAMLFANTAGQQDFYQLNAMAANGTTQFVQYAPASTTMLEVQHRNRQTHSNSAASRQQCVQMIGQQSAIGESFMEQGGEQPPVQPLCQTSTTPQASLFGSASPSSTTADSPNYINNNER